jgi:hypothetical protein
MREDVKRCHISEETKEMIAAAKQMNKMNLFPVIFDVYDDKVLGDILALIDFKKSIK